MQIPNNSNRIIQLNGIRDSKIVIGNNAKVTIIGEINEDRNIEITIGENSELRSYLIQKNGSLNQKNIAQPNSRIYSNTIYFGGGNGKVVNALEGNRSKAYDVQVFAIDSEKKLLIDTTLLHIGKDTGGNILVKGIAKDNSMAKIDGMIKIEKNASGANSMLDEHVMLLNPGARADTNPQLEIENNDVMSTHAASVSQIDENKIFYMMSRGLDRENARKLIIEGFLSSAIEKIDNKEIKKKITELISGAI